ncbi:MAG: hypothetical protein BYD32DRAFT_489006 [Podila humilis]|nr:MAG: hypothetical protein BYD32DRAFT_489006 [Podila humilis]
MSNSTRLQSKRMLPTEHDSLPSNHRQKKRKPNHLYSSAKTQNTRQRVPTESFKPSPPSATPPQTSSGAHDEESLHAEGMEHWEQRLMDRGFDVDYSTIDEAVRIWLNNGAIDKEVSVSEAADEFLGAMRVIAPRRKRKHVRASSRSTSSFSPESVGSQHRWIFKLVDRDSVVVVCNLIKEARLLTQERNDGVRLLAMADLVHRVRHHPISPCQARHPLSDLHTYSFQSPSPEPQHEPQPQPQPQKKAQTAPPTQHGQPSLLRRSQRLVARNSSK